MLPEITTPRLTLRETCLEDAPGIQAYQAEPDQWRNQAVEPEELADAELRIQRYFEHKGPDDARRLFVFTARERASNNRVVGQASISRSHPAIGHLGFGVGATFAGAGFATEMAQAMLRFGFEDVGLHRLVANVAVENLACIRVVEKIDMVREGVEREAIWAQDRWWTEAMYSMLEGEYERL
ncbi:GNAT family N-acetyltransferase [Jiella marina]|uniref:GNAT family N-acetyltransferase n=1 Tax=Jiella sp. LLJ827 TaxID=2917712 RepID=UPI0021007D2C|nr:GNAT family protein [Jiella sp. LLJ827]MCQ0990369.1 GNAT family N-acetyltransferase [Jiella sp. LLJ827]